MDELVKEVIPLLQYLIPGFLTAWIFYSLTAFKRPDTFGQIVQALIFTFVIHGAVLIVKAALLWIGSNWFMIGQWDVKAEASWSFVISVLLGLLSCYWATNDKLHTWLRNRDITKQTSYPSEWYSTFARHERFVVLHLNDERRLYGWPSEWPSDPSSGQFVIEGPSWLESKGERPFGADFVVIDSSKVQWVEFTHAVSE
ncbi:DUF6338 family protein [Pseudomonas sp. MWU318]|uniref:DUF6338 family protein n=1 Tax=Pseudomonas sp. MWU318 TaxID=2802569 RepID=UPI00192725EC|nr:DUF6338 family protein [Pseudomonas sp. MWU318]